jgi:hypothetical protein
MLRRSVLYLFRDDATSDERSRLLHGLSFVGLEVPSVAAGDYGDDIAGGSKRLVEIPPWKRTPRFHARSEGPPSNFDLALHLDFADEAALAAYEGHPAHRQLDRFAASVTVEDLTARVDWRYDGQPANERGHYRHTALHIWRDDADQALRSRTLDGLHRLAAAPGIESVATGESLSGDAADFDWVLDVQLADEAAARAFLAGDHCGEVLQAVAGATKHEWTARVTHLMRGT